MQFDTASQNKLSIYEKEVTMDKETNNILELKAYMATNPTLNHISGAVDLFYADVEYKDSTLGEYTLQNVEIRFEHGYNNTLKIDALRPPYYGEFWLTKQDFRFMKGNLNISGLRHDNGKKYCVVIK